MIGARPSLEILTLGIVVPLLGLVAMVIGPLFLMRDRHYNDVLDGATFGVASAVAFVGAQVVAGSVDLFAGGLTPVGEILPWVGRILAIAVALPVVAAGAVGATVGAFWLRYRAPVRDRAALGAAGRPAIAVALAAGLIVATALAAYLPGPVVNVAVQLGLAAVALVWLRRTLHVRAARGGLRDRDRQPDHLCELRPADAPAHVLRQLRDRVAGAPETATGGPPPRGRPPPTTPAAPPPAASGTAGVSGPRRILPSPAPCPAPPAVPGRPHWAPPGDAGPRLSGRSVLIGFAVIVGVCLALAVALALLSHAPEPPPDCQPGTECGGPPAGGVEASAEPTPVDRPSTPVSTPVSPATIPAGTVGIRAGSPCHQRDPRLRVRVLGLVGDRHPNPDPTETDLQYPGHVG